MPFCPRCGKELPSDVRFCLECGAAVAAPAALPAVTPAKPESKTARNIVIAVVLIALLLVVGGLGYVLYETSERTFVEESPFIGYNHYWHVSTVFHGGTSIDVTVRVEEGGPIDVLLMDSKDFLEFQRFMDREIESFHLFKRGSALNVKQISFTFTFPSTDRYFIVLNNAGGVEGGAKPVGAVTVYVKVIVHLLPFQLKIEAKHGVGLAFDGFSPYLEGRGVATTPVLGEMSQGGYGT